MPKFQLLGGKHYEKGDAEPYRNGEVVESDLPLDKLFANKFMPLDRPIPAEQTGARRRPKAPKGPVGSMANVDQDDVPNTMKARTIQNDDVYDNIKDHQEVLAGKRKGTTTKAVIASTLSSRDVGGSPTDDDEEDTPKAARGQESGEEGSSLGEDVSDQFDGAVDAGLIVYKEKANKYHVVHEDTPGEPISKKAGLKKVEVRSFIKKQAAKAAAAQAEEDAPAEE